MDELKLFENTEGGRRNDTRTPSPGIDQVRSAYEERFIQNRLLKKRAHPDKYRCDASDEISPASGVSPRYLSSPSPPPRRRRRIWESSMSPESRDESHLDSSNDSIVVANGSDLPVKRQPSYHKNVGGGNDSLVKSSGQLQRCRSRFDFEAGKVSPGYVSPAHVSPRHVNYGHVRSPGHVSSRPVKRPRCTYNDVDSSCTESDDDDDEIVQPVMKRGKKIYDDVSFLSGADMKPPVAAKRSLKVYKKAAVDSVRPVKKVSSEAGLNKSDIRKPSASKLSTTGNKSCKSFTNRARNTAKATEQSETSMLAARSLSASKSAIYIPSIYKQQPVVDMGDRVIPVYKPRGRWFTLFKSNSSLVCKGTVGTKINSQNVYQSCCFKVSSSVTEVVLDCFR